MSQKSAVEPEGSHFYPLCKAVSELHKKIPVPEPLSAFCCALSEGPRDDEVCCALSEGPRDDEVFGALSEGPRDDEVKELSEPQPTEVKVSVDVYKYRGSRKERAFIPGVPTAPKPSLEFLSLHMDTATGSSIKEEQEHKGTQILPKRRKFHYQPLRLKQTVPNPEKIRKKELKKKRR